VKRLWIVIAAVLLASCQSDSAATDAAPTDKSREAAERDRKVNDVQEQMRNMQH